MSAPVIQLQPKKVFVAKHGEIPLLLDYSRAPESWWEHWLQLTWEQGKLLKSPIHPGKMVAWARKAGHHDMATVLEIANDVKYGCDLGTRGEHLCPSSSTNAPSAWEFAARVTRDGQYDAVTDSTVQ